MKRIVATTVAVIAMVGLVGCRPVDNNRKILPDKHGEVVGGTVPGSDSDPSYTLILAVNTDPNDDVFIIVDKETFYACSIGEMYPKCAKE